MDVEEAEEEEEEDNKKEEGCAGIPISSSVGLVRAVSSSTAIAVITSLEDEITDKEAPETAV